MDSDVFVWHIREETTCLPASWWSAGRWSNKEGHGEQALHERYQLELRKASTKTRGKQKKKVRCRRTVEAGVETTPRSVVSAQTVKQQQISTID